MEAEADIAGRTAVGSQDPTLQTAEVGVGAPVGKSWTPPQGLGPIPADLVQIARNVEAAQKAAVVRLEEAKRTTARHLAAVQSVPEGRTSGRAVFLDVTS
jgi:hypothetical protein